MKSKYLWPKVSALLQLHWEKISVIFFCVKEMPSLFSVHSFVAHLPPGSTTQSSVYRNKKADRALDGRVRQEARFCSFTKEEQNPWWQLNLGKYDTTEGVVLWTNM